MQQTGLPYIRPSINKRLLSKRLISEPNYKSLHDTITTTPYQHTIHIRLMKDINKAKRKVQKKISPIKAKEVVTLQESVDCNKNFERQLKLLIYRSRDPELIGVIENKDKRNIKLPRLKSEKKTVSEHIYLLEDLRRREDVVSKMYSRKRTAHTISLRDSYLDPTQCTAVNGFPHYRLNL